MSRIVTKHLIFSIPGGGLSSLDVSFNSDDQVAAEIGAGALISIEELILEEARRKGCTLKHSHVSHQRIDAPDHRASN